MKKLIALTLMVVCFACCTLGCGDKKPAKPATPPAAATTDGAADAKPADSTAADAK